MLEEYSGIETAMEGRKGNAHFQRGRVTGVLDTIQAIM